MPEQLFQIPEREELFQPAPRPNKAGPVAFNRAYVDSIVAQDPWSLPNRERVQSDYNVLDESVRVIGELVESGRIKDTGELANWDELPTEEKVERAKFMLNKQDMNKATPRNVALLIALESDAGIDMETFDQVYRSLNSGEVQRMLDQYRRQQQYRLRKEYEHLLESTDAEGAWEQVGGFAAGELVPFYSVLARLGLSQELLDTIKPDANMGLKGWFTGEVRQEIRKTLASMSPDERVQAVRAMVDAVERMEQDPVLGEMLIDYNINETFEQLLTEDLVKRNAPENTFDRWVGNAEVALGGLFTGWLLTKLGFSSTSRALKASSKVPAKQAADAVANRDYIASFQDALVNSDVGAKFNISKEAAAVEQLPKPASMVDDISVLTPGQRDILERSNLVRDEILGATSRITGYNLNAADKVNAVRKKIEDLNLGDQMEIMPGMSTIRMMDEDVGFEIEAVIGKNVNEGWDNLEDLALQLEEIDSDLANFTVVRRNADGVLEPVFENPNELKALLDDGQLPVKEDPYIYAGLRLSEISDDDLLRISREDGEIRGAIEREAIRRANTEPLHDEYFLKHKQERFWHNADRLTFSPEAFTSAGFVPRFMLAPNSKFGDEIYGTFNRLWMQEQSLARNLESMFDPYYKLGVDDKKAVASMFEWAESFGKREGRNPTLSDYYANFNDITPKQVEGLIALREGHDTMFELLNRRLYREYSTKGYKTARPLNEGLPVYHGERLDRATATGKQAYDPVAQRVVPVTDDLADEIYGEGGAVLRNDLPVDVPNDPKAQADLIIARAEHYDVGELSTTPMKYHPGYSMRFYEDPYFIVKEVEGVTLNGQPVRGVSKQAVRTAPTRLAAENYLRRGANTWDPNTGTFVYNKDPSVRWRVVRARDVDQSESTFLQKQSIQQEGRLFWDERNFDRLPDVSGNTAEIDDPVKSIERAVGLLSRQVTMEDAMKGVKNAFQNEFSKLPGLKQLDVNTQEMGTVVKELRRLRRNNADKGLDRRYQQAIELGNYIRMMEGVSDDVVPLVRKALIEVAYTVDRLGGRKLATGLEKYAENFDPLRTMRSVAFNLFMTFRPVRQALLQSAQIGFLSPLDPTYVYSGRLFKDSFMLRRGIAKLRMESYDDGFSVNSAARMMGLKPKEYRKLIKEFDRSGLIDTVDVHSFAGGVRRYNKTALPKSELGRVGYGVRKGATGIRDFMQNIGFNFGERNNITFTYLMAVRKAKKKYGVNSILEFSQRQWDELTTDASNLALGMIRPNNFGYQQGFFSVGTQFLSFTHKAGLALLAQNPAIKGLDALKILVGSYMLYGANMLGVRDAVNEALRQAGISEGVNDPLLPDGQTLVDVLSGGLLEKAFNSIASLTFDDDEYQDIDFGFLAPGVDVVRLRELGLETIAKSLPKAALGPFGTIGAKFLEAHRDVRMFVDGFSDQMGPGDKVITIAHLYGQGLMPLYNDVIDSYIAYKMGRWANSAGETMPVNAALNSVLARGLLGARSREELAYYRIRENLWEDEQVKRDIIKANREMFSKLWYLKGEELTVENYAMAVQAMTSWMEDWPEGVKAEIIEASLTEAPEGEKAIIGLLAEDPRYQTPDVRAAVETYLDKQRVKGNITPEQEQQIRQMAKELYESRVEVENQLRERLRTGE